ncbi:MAG: helix-turn-helix transcriptional regulator [Coriobacteriia bacterium]|nr:helix-turn-helix transcriptional regulator [Coriobacteriia bacterium]
MAFDPALLAKRRAALGLTAAELARRAGINRSIISGIEHGRLTPYPSQIRRIKAVLDTSPTSGKNTALSLRAT